MRVIYCDACGKQVESARKVEIPCHLWSKRGQIGYVDNDMNRVSGRNDTLDMCSACLNRAYSAMVAEIDWIVKER